MTILIITHCHIFFFFFKTITNFFHLGKFPTTLLIYYSHRIEDAHAHAKTTIINVKVRVVKTFLMIYTPNRKKHFWTIIRIII